MILRSRVDAVKEAAMKDPRNLMRKGASFTFNILQLCCMPMSRNMTRFIDFNV